jgi:hypothetical protein
MYNRVKKGIQESLWDDPKPLLKYQPPGNWAGKKYKKLTPAEEIRGLKEMVESLKNAMPPGNLKAWEIRWERNHGS